MGTALRDGGRWEVSGEVLRENGERERESGEGEREREREELLVFFFLPSLFLCYNNFEEFTLFFDRRNSKRMLRALAGGPRESRRERGSRSTLVRNLSPVFLFFSFQKDKPRTLPLLC